MTADDFLPSLHAACPSAADKWAEHVAYWRGDHRGDYIDLSVYAHHIVDSFREGRTGDFPQFFARLEEMITAGTAAVVELATIGLIEDIQNIASHEKFGYRVFEPWLGPASRREWARIEALWEGRSTLAQVVRDELG